MTDLNLETPKAPGQKDAPDPSLGGPVRHIVASAHKWGGNGAKPDFNKIKRVLMSRHPEVIAKAFGGNANVAAAWIKDNWAASHGISYSGKTGAGPTYWRKGGGDHAHASMLCAWWQPAADALFLGGDDEAELFLADTAPEESNGLIWKTILREGTWKRNPIPGENKPLVIDRQFMEDLIAANQDGAWEFVTIPLTHADRVHENTGYVRHLKIVEQGGKAALRAGLEFTEPDIKQKVLNGSIANVSVGVGFNVARTDTGKSYPRVLKHVALTNAPWINGLPAFGSEEMAAGKIDPASVRFAYIDEADDLSEVPDDFSCLLHLPDEVMDWPVAVSDRLMSKVHELAAAIEDVYSTDSVGNVEIRRNVEQEAHNAAASGAAIVGDGSSGGTDDDDDSVGFPAEVHHMDSADPVVNCASCIHFANQTCGKYAAATEATDVCDSYENVAGDEMGDKGSIDGLNAALPLILEPTADELLLAAKADVEAPLSAMKKGDVFVSHNGHTYAHMGSHPVKKNHIAAVHTATGKMTSFPHGMVVKKVTTPMPPVADGVTRYTQIGPPAYGGYLSRGGDHMSEETKELQLTRDDLDKIVAERVETELNAARESAKAEAAEERKALELELSRNRRAVHEMKVRERVAELSKAGHSPAIVKVAQELMLADDRGETMLTLSREGADVQLSITDVVNELMEAFPKSDITTDAPRKMDLSIKPESGEDSVEAANKDYESLFGVK